MAGEHPISNFFRKMINKPNSDAQAAVVVPEKGPDQNYIARLNDTRSMVIGTIERLDYLDAYDAKRVKGILVSSQVPPTKENVDYVLEEVPLRREILCQRALDAIDNSLAPSIPRLEQFNSGYSDAGLSRRLKDQFFFTEADLANWLPRAIVIRDRYRKIACDLAYEAIVGGLYFSNNITENTFRSHCVGAGMNTAEVEESVKRYFSQRSPSQS